MMTRAEKFMLSASILLLALSVYVHFVSANASDKNWLLVAARMWLSGKKLYTDIFEINPPLIIWLYAAPVWISRHLPFLSDYNALALLGFAAVALVIHLCLCIIALHPAFAGDKRKQLAFALLLAYVFVFFTAPMYFFDKEGILLVLTFPYVLRFTPALARQIIPLPLRLFIGSLAAIGFCIKPHTAIFFAILQLLYIVRERSFSILISVENLIIYLLGGLYLTVIALGVPEYLHTILPMAMATYSAYSRKANGAYSIIGFIVMMGITFADFRPRHTSPFRREVYYFLGICAAYLIYALFNNGWAYTYHPLLSVMCILTGWVRMEFLWLEGNAQAQGLPSKPFLHGARSCAFNLFANVAFYSFCYVIFLLPFDCDQTPSCRSTEKFFEAARQIHARSFGAMSLEFYKWSQLSRETGEQWDTRFNHLWMLPKFLLSDSEFTRRNHWIIDYVGRAYAEDLSRWKPDVMFIDTSPELFRNQPGIDLPGYFSQVAAFREEWKQYALSGVIDACEAPPKGEPPSNAVKIDCRFDVYSRKPSP